MDSYQADQESMNPAEIVEARLPGQDPEACVRLLLERLFARDVCRAIMAPLRLEDAAGVAPALVRDPALLAGCAVLAPTMPLAEATVAGALTVGEGAGPIGIVLHPCQLRAFVELAKLHQANRDDVVLISVDCAGVYDARDFNRIAAAGPNGSGLVAGLRGGAPQAVEGFSLREACLACEGPIPELADVRVRVVGAPEGELRVQASRAMVRRLGLEEVAPADDGAVLHLLQARTEARERRLAEFGRLVGDARGLLSQFAACVRCLNCMSACPLCYCKECIFRTETFDHRPADYLRWAERKGAARLPADTLLFHLTRLNHMATSCVGCGLCEAACPNDLPVSALFRLVGRRVQSLFDYSPGRDWAEELPVAAFRENELE